MSAYLVVSTSAFILFAVIQLYFFERIMKPVNKYFKREIKQSATKSPIQKPVTVIVCAKNEAPNLKSFIPKLLDQKYPKFEVLVVNDESSDASASLLEKMSSASSILRYITINGKDRPSNWNPKKWALQQGINHACYDTLLLTDADCYPSSRYWIANMAASLTEGKEVVLGFSFYEKRDTILNQIIQFETFQTALLYAGFTLKDKAYMAVGRNLLYTKNFFKRCDGFSGIESVTGGDDDLFIQKTDDQSIIGICPYPDGITLSLPEEQFGHYFNQKIRHLNAGKHYSNLIRLPLSFFYASQMGFWPLAVLLLLSVNSLHYIWLLGIVVVYVSRQYVLYKNFSTKFELFNLIRINPLVEILYSWNFLLQGAGTFFSKRIRWK